MSDSKERAEFEADAEALGYDLTRQTCACPNPACEYQDGYTGNRWAGWLAARAQQQAASVPANLLEQLQAQMHYPACWDTAAYPTFADALNEALEGQGCSACNVRLSISRHPTPTVPDGLVERLKAQSAAHRYMAEADSADLLDEAIAALAAAPTPRAPADVMADAEKWRSYAEHMEWCADCAEAVDSCHEGSALRDAARAAEKGTT